jgi:hypothetical protein
MPDIFQYFSYLLGIKKRKLKHKNQSPPSIKWLIEHRTELAEKVALTKGATPTASLYRMYEYLVVGYTTALRSEIEYFFNKPGWAVEEIPDPADPDPARYAILAVLTQYLALAFNRLIERGLPRGSPAIIAGPDVEDELRRRAIVLEKEPPWVAAVPKLEETLIIPDESGKDPAQESRSQRFLDMNIIAEEPHVLFV